MLQEKNKPNEILLHFQYLTHTSLLHSSGVRSKSKCVFGVQNGFVALEVCQLIIVLGMAYVDIICQMPDENAGTIFRVGFGSVLVSLALAITKRI